MASNLGINIDPSHDGGRPSMADLAKFGWVRLVAHRKAAVRDFVVEARQNGIRCLVVLARESFTTNDFAADAERYANLLGGDGVVFSIGNEPDAGWTSSDSPDNLAANRAPHHPSSWCMDPPDFSELVKTCSTAIRNARPTATVITAGLSSGNPEFLARCGTLPVDGVAIHAYGQRPEPSFDAWAELPGNFGFIGNLLSAYSMFGLPMWVTEVGVTTTQASDAFQAQYCEAIMRHLRDRSDVVAGFWFCYSDGMVPQYGLLRADGSRRPSFDAFPS